MSLRPPEPSGGVIRSSTFHKALAVCLLVWGVMAAALWIVVRDEAGMDAEATRAEIEEDFDDVLHELAVVAWEMQHDDDPVESDGGDTEAGERDLDDAGTEDDPEADEPELEVPDDVEFEAEDWSASALLALLRAERWTREWLEEEHFCWQLVGAEGEWLDGNLSAAPASGEAGTATGSVTWQRVTGVEVDVFELDDEAASSSEMLREAATEHPRRCLVRELALAGGGRLRLGRDLDSLLLEPRLLAGLALSLLGLGVALCGSYLIARRVVRFVDDLRLARTRLESDALPRLRRPRDRGDFDRAAGEINAILHRLDSAMGSLAHVTDNIAHDLRTPLTRLQGQLDILRRSGRPTDAMISAVQEEADQLLSTFNALLRIAQLESGHRKRGFRRFDLARVVADVGELYAPAFAERDMAFHCRSPAAPVELDGDADLWMQALSNLLDNALKFTPDGGRVEIELRHQQPPQLILRDSGPGIPESEREKVFERFFRCEHHRGSQGTRGAGLGLTLVAAICELHGVTIRLENDGGLVVHLLWPAPAA